MEYSKVLFNEPPLVVSPRLAAIMGLNEAIVLQQIHYWLQKSDKIYDDKAWTYATYAEWQAQFPFWSTRTIRRIIDNLTSNFIVVKGNFNKASFDNTLWYSIDYEALDAFVKNDKSKWSSCPHGNGQDEQTEKVKLSTPIPKTSTKTSTKTSLKKEKATNFDVLLAEHTQNSVLIDTLRDFIKMRTTSKKPLTDRALKMLLSKLKLLAKNEAHQVKLLEQSIFNCWQDVYPLKDGNSQFSGFKSQQGLQKYGTPNYDEE
jgi:hypothetical protein